MTRLTTEDVACLDASLGSLDDRLRAVTGLDLKTMAAEASGVPGDSIESAVIKVVPMTCGQGRLGGFSEAVAAIIEHLGGWAEVTYSCDACGMAEAVRDGADAVFLADDDKFVALDLVRRRVVDNAQATALGFVHALHQAAGDIVDRETLVIGAGPVGRTMVSMLQERGAKVLLAETNPVRAALPGTTRVDFVEGLGRAELVLNASPAPIKGRWLRKGAIVSSPGVPFGYDQEALSKATIIHDPLPTGVAVMTFQALNEITMTKIAEQKEVAQDGY